MTEPDKGVYTDGEIAPQIISLIDSSEKWVVLVTPYLEFTEWRHLKRAIARAAERGVSVRCLVRDEEKQVNSDDVHWLRGRGIDVLKVERLHAKIYMNEKRTLLTSMNLTSSSAQNSLEIALAVRTDDAALVRSYVNDTLLKSAKPVEGRGSEPPQPSGAPHAAKTGRCIRCRSVIGLDPSRPLCDACYDTWAEFQNEDYTEKYCHVCGRPWDTSYARPLCRSCFDSAAR